MRSLTALGLLAVAAGWGLAAWAQSAGPRPDPAAGKALAAQLCRSCHLISPEDKGPVPDGVPSFLALAERPGQDETSLMAALVKQHPVMPQPPLTSRQADDVVAYILSLRR